MPVTQWYNFGKLFRDVFQASGFPVASIQAKLSLAKPALAKAGGGEWLTAAWSPYSSCPERCVILLLLMWYNLCKAFKIRRKDRNSIQSWI